MTAWHEGRLMVADGAGETWWYCVIKQHLTISWPALNNVPHVYVFAVARNIA